VVLDDGEAGLMFDGVPGPGLTFARESFAAALASGGYELVARQYAEAGHVEAGPFHLNHDFYQAADQMDRLRIYIARVESRPVGFASYFVFFGAHASGTKVALGDAFGVLPEWRRPFVALRLLRFAEQQLTLEGVRAMHTQDNERFPGGGRLLERLGHKPISRTYVKVLNDA
jgi:GNAT superfamily N-acetyltransferase